MNIRVILSRTPLTLLLVCLDISVTSKTNCQNKEDEAKGQNQETDKLRVTVPLSSHTADSKLFVDFIGVGDLNVVLPLRA